MENMLIENLEISFSVKNADFSVSAESVISSFKEYLPKFQDEGVGLLLMTHPDKKRRIVSFRSRLDLKCMYSDSPEEQKEFIEYAINLFNQWTQDYEVECNIEIDMFIASKNNELSKKMQYEENYGTLKNLVLDSIGFNLELNGSKCDLWLISSTKQIDSINHKGGGASDYIKGFNVQIDQSVDVAVNSMFECDWNFMLNDLSVEINEYINNNFK